MQAFSATRKLAEHVLEAFLRGMDGVNKSGAIPSTDDGLKVVEGGSLDTAV
jgi:hypothetical protein